MYIDIFLQIQSPASKFGMRDKIKKKNFGDLHIFSAKASQLYTNV